MSRNDARKRTAEQLTDLRKRAVEAVQNGESPVVVARVMGVSVGAVFGWLALYRHGGWDALNAKKRGGRKPKLNAAQLRWLYKTIASKNPMQLQFAFALWTSRMVRELIKRRFSICLSKASVCRLLQQLGLSPQKPLWRAFQQDKARVQRWLDTEYPAIRKEARRVGARIFFADEASVRSDFHAGTTWAPRGKTPVVSTTGARFSVNMISAVSAQGEMRFMIVSRNVTASVFIEFLRRLLQNSPTPIFVVVDGHPVHRSAAVARFVAATEEKLRVFFLPGYSPELNPDEQVWNDLKNNCLGRKLTTGPNQLKASVLSRLRSIQKRPDRVRSFFFSWKTRSTLLLEYGLF